MNHSVLGVARSVILAEIDAVTVMLSSVGEDFEKAVDLILKCEGRVVVIGMGKSGIVGRKISATLASTGTISYFIHPAEAFHGDLGMIRADDIILMLSNSGETEELVRLVPFFKHQKNKIIAILGNEASTLAKNSDVFLSIMVEKEACVNNLAPTSSTTCCLVLGDALAVTLSTMKNFKAVDFARFHPGGSLGRKLLGKVKDVMKKDNLPLCSPNDSVADIVSVVTAGRMGVAIVVEDGLVCGIITDGDIRSVFAFDDPLAYRAVDIMTVDPLSVDANESLIVAGEKMQEAKKRVFIVTEDGGKFVGIVQVFDL